MNAKMIAPRAKAVLDYWFGPSPADTAAYFQERNRMWFMGGKKVDEEIAALFRDDVEAAEKGELSTWERDPREALALVLLLDQFALNLYRDQARGYRCGDLALPVARKLLGASSEKQFCRAEMVFLFMPLEHSESAADQADCVALFKAMKATSPPGLADLLDGYVQFAERHQRVIAEFGRFPHRNEALGRPSTANELAFLASPRAPF